MSKLGFRNNIQACLQMLHLNIKSFTQMKNQIAQLENNLNENMLALETSETCISSFIENYESQIKTAHSTKKQKDLKQERYQFQTILEEVNDLQSKTNEMDITINELHEKINIFVNLLDIIDTESIDSEEEIEEEDEDFDTVSMIQDS